MYLPTHYWLESKVTENELITDLETPPLMIVEAMLDATTAK